MIRDFVQEFIIEEERPFDSAHASTVLEIESGVLATWCTSPTPGTADASYTAVLL